MNKIDGMDKIDSIDNIDNNTTVPTNNGDISIDEDLGVQVFNNALHQYLKIDEEIKTLMNAIKMRNEIKRNLGDTLSNYLRLKQINKVNLDGSYKGKFIETEVKTSVSKTFSKELVTEALINELKDEQELFDKIMTFLSKTSVMKEVWRLKISDEKKTRSKSSSSTKSRKKKESEFAAAAALIEDE